MGVGSELALNCNIACVHYQCMRYGTIARCKLSHKDETETIYYVQDQPNNVAVIINFLQIYNS